MDANLFGMSRAPQIGGTAVGGGGNFSGAPPRTSMPVGQPQRFGGPSPMQPMTGAGGMQPAMGGMQSPGNSLFGHSQGLGMGQNSMQQGHNTMQPPIGVGPSQPMGQNQIPPEILMQLMQLFGSSQVPQNNFGMQHRA